VPRSLVASLAAFLETAHAFRADTVDHPLALA
jgi:hypothetical protein